MKELTAREANQRFSACLKAVEGGEAFVITKRGKPVARLVPASEARILTAEQRAARERSRRRMREGIDLGGTVGFDRASLHER